MARPLSRPRHTLKCKCVVCARARGRAQNPKESYFDRIQALIQRALRVRRFDLYGRLLTVVRRDYGGDSAARSRAVGSEMAAVESALLEYPPDAEVADFVDRARQGGRSDLASEILAYVERIRDVDQDRVSRHFLIRDRLGNLEARLKATRLSGKIRNSNPFMLGPAVAGAIGGAVGGALTGALRNPPKGRKKNPSLALVGLGLPNPGRRGRRAPRAKNPALALVGLGLPNPPRAQNPTNHACAKDRGYRGEISLEEARRRARETGKLAEFEKSIKYYRATHGKAPTSVAVYAYDDGSRQKRVSFGVVFGKSDQIFYEDTPDGKKRNRDGSNKKWVHETSRKAPPSLVWFADTGLLGYVGGALHVNSSGRDAGWLLD